MTPEQEDAHWALQGKPLMRHWRAYCQAVVAHQDYNRKARLRGAMGDGIGATVLTAYAAAERDKSLEIWNRCGFEYEPFGATAGGVYYARAEGEINDP